MPHSPSHLYLVELTWIIFWSKFYKCLINWLHNNNTVNNSVDLVSINVRFIAAPLTGMNESADTAEKRLISSKVPLRPPKPNCCEGQLTFQCLSWIILWIIKLYGISIALHIPRHTMLLRKCFVHVFYSPPAERILSHWAKSWRVFPPSPDHYITKCTTHVQKKMEIIAYLSFPWFSLKVNWTENCGVSFSCARVG